MKQMLWKVVSKEGRDWDRLIPYIVFAYREVPQASTGFSPFELVYGRDVRGPLEVLKEEWVEHRAGGDDIAQMNLKMTQGRQKHGMTRKHMKCNYRKVTQS